MIGISLPRRRKGERALALGVNGAGPGSRMPNNLEVDLPRSPIDPADSALLTRVLSPLNFGLSCYVTSLYNIGSQMPCAFNV